ncbi:MAG: 2-C-methyl-D-erythritol 4-phosphate cytidylyltransferase, partial [Agathobacter sp.]|uniref:IspD/TarI family cytidylyltransferase n=1 Tax=Agathobacter sp. TaxID=2021311 RepID=UPI00258ECD76
EDANVNTESLFAVHYSNDLSAGRDNCVPYRFSDGGTPKRSTLWQVQTPQTFRYDTVLEAFDKLYGSEHNLEITDDVMVVEAMLGIHGVMVEGSYSNIKLTTLEDLEYAKAIMDE